MQRRGLFITMAYAWLVLPAAAPTTRASDALLDSPAGEGAPTLEAVTVQATAISGAPIDADKVPGNVQVLSATEISQDGAANLTHALDNRLGSVNINDTLDDPFQPDILYRGFEASPVLGTPQGLAVYQNGVRINEAFGNTVNWDLFPDVAVQSVELISSSPVYGLNALGGGVSIRMKDGFSYRGAETALSAGSFGNHAASLQYGANADGLGIYVAGNALENSGWRPYSDDSLRQLYVVASAHSDRATLDLAYTRGDNQMDGQGSAPVQELAVNRSLVFTGPQTNLNRLNFLTLNATVKTGDDWSLQALGYYRQYQQVVSNGNTTGYTACTEAPYTANLCQSDGLTPLYTASGQIIPDISQGGTTVIGENDFETINAYGRGLALQSSLNAPVGDLGNAFVAGAAVDYAELNFLSGAQIGTINSQRFINPSPWTVDTTESSPFGASPVYLKGFDRNYGLYLTDTLDVSAQGSVTASLRYNSASIDLQDVRGSALTGDNRYVRFNPALGGTYKLTPTVTAYAGYSENTRTPTASEIECSNPLTPCLLPTNLAGDPPTLKQVVAHTFEFGLRGKIELPADSVGSLAWNLGAFRTNLQDDIYGISTTISTGFFANIGSTRRQGIEAGLDYHSVGWSAYLNYSLVDATFESALTVPSPSNPFQDATGNIEVYPGDHVPGIPEQRIKAGVDYKILPNWSVGGSVKFVSSSYYSGDESNQNAPLPGYRVVGLHSSYDPTRRLELFAHIDNVLNAKFATYGIFSDPTGVGAPGVPVNGITNGPGVDNRFQSPAYPFAVYAGLRLRL
jgi:iron complex outermembrane receptor protein